MKITVNLGQEQEQQLHWFLQQNHLELSEFAKSAILDRLAQETIISNSPYEVGKTLFGRFGSGETERSVQRKRLVREKIHAKYRDR